jgi:TolB protein
VSAQGEQINISDITNTKFDEINPSISPDGKYILFQAKENHKYSLYLMGIDGKHKNPLTEYHDVIIYSDGAWAPDSYHLAYGINYEDVPGDIVVGTTDQDGSSQAGAHITRKQGMNLYPGWSPSGKQLVFVSDMHGQSDLYIILADGSGIFRVTDDGAVEQSPDWFAP